jgi:hypothetical protein
MMKKVDEEDIFAPYEVEVHSDFPQSPSIPRTNLLTPVLRVNISPALPDGC